MGRWYITGKNKMKKNILRSVLLIAAIGLISCAMSSCSKKCQCSFADGTASVLDPDYYGVKSCNQLESVIAAQYGYAADCTNS